MATVNTCNDRSMGSSADGYSSHNNSVGFRMSNKTGDDPEEDERKKYLTAKYPHHTMKLIRKRLEVEDWVDNQLKELYNVEDDNDSYDTELDLDEILDIETSSERHSFIQEQLMNAKKSPEAVNKFVEDLLEKCKQL